jgi:hypothetical protein
VRLAALERQIDEAKAELEQSYAELSSMKAALSIFVLVPLAIALFDRWGREGVPDLLYVVGVLAIIGGFHRGLKRMKRVLKTLEGKKEEQGAHSAIASTNQSVSQAEPISQAELSLPPVPDTDPILSARARFNRRTHHV